MSLRMIWTAHAASNGVNGRNKRRITADRGRREVLVYLRRIESSVNNESAASSSRSSSTCPMLRELIDSDGSYDAFSILIFSSLSRDSRGKEMRPGNLLHAFLPGCVGAHSQGTRSYPLHSISRVMCSRNQSNSPGEGQIWFLAARTSVSYPPQERGA